MEPRRDGDVELHEGGYWDGFLCTGVGVGGRVGVDDIDRMCSGRGVGSGCGNSDGIGSIGGSRLCGSGFWVK